MDQMEQDHLRYARHDQAAAIAAERSCKFAALEIIGPGDAECGRYVADYSTLVPGIVRMRTHLTPRGFNQHSCNLQPVTASAADQRRFIGCMTPHHPSISPRKGGRCVKPPGWARANINKSNYVAISADVQSAQKVLTVPAPVGSVQ